MTRHASARRLRTSILLGFVSLLIAPAGQATEALGLLGSSTVTHDDLGDTGVENQFGNRVASGDFNGDGFMDLAIGDPFDSTSAIWQGAVHIVYGSPAGLLSNGDQTLRQGASGVLGSAEASDKFGAALAVGNFNNDAWDDLAVGVPEEGIGSIGDAGSVIVFYGSDTGLRTDNEVDFHQNSPGVSGAAQAGDNFGAALAAGDFNGDGNDDLAIGVPGEDTGAVPAVDAGLLVVLYGSASGITSAGDGAWEQGFSGLSDLPETNDQLGYALVADDFDNDGYDDLVIGVPGERVAGFASAGAIHVLEGSGSGLSTTTDTFWTSDLGGINAAEVGGRFGERLAACDFNKDLRADLVVGMPAFNYAGFADAGITFVFDGSATGLTTVGSESWAQSLNLPGTPADGDLLGNAIACADFDNDGYADLAIASTRDDELSTGTIVDGGKIDVIYGTPGGLSPFDIQSWDRGIMGLGNPPAANDFWGSALTAGDFDSNDHPDLAIAMVPFSADGEVDVLFGGISDFGELFFDDPDALNTNASTDSGKDQWQELATDGAGNWVAVWQSDDDLAGTIGTDLDILVARSANGGMTWSAPAALATNAVTDSGADQDPHVATDGAGNWVAIWSSTENLGGTIETDADVFVSRSTNAGLDWTAPVALHSNLASDVGDDTEPRVATDGAGNWLAVWVSWEDIGGNIGTDNDIIVSRSTNAGAIWTAPEALSPVFASFDSSFAHDYEPSIAADAAGNMVVAWQVVENVLVSSSANAGLTWTFPKIFDEVYSGRPSVATDGGGTWLAVWGWTDLSFGAPSGGDSDLLVTRSINGGINWTQPALLSTNATTDSGDDRRPDVAADGAGNWVVVWETNDRLQDQINNDLDIVYSLSMDGGVSWTDTLPVLDTAGSDGVRDRGATVTADRGSTWIVAWSSENDLGGTIDSDYDILFARARDSDGDGSPNYFDNCEDDYNPDQSNLDSFLGGDVCDVCPDDILDMCNPSRSASTTVGSAGSTLSTPDSAVSISVPAGALATDVSLSITDSGNGELFALQSDFGPGTALYQVSIGRDGGLSFASSATVTLSWNDSTPEDGIVDGTTIDESLLIFTKDGADLAGRCFSAIGPIASTGSECDTTANTFRVEVSSLSDFALVVATSTWSFAGTPAGGSVEFTIDGVMFIVATLAGQTVDDVASNVAAAIDADATLAGLGITATAAGSTVMTNGILSDTKIKDSGLVGAVHLPSLSSTAVATLVGLLVLAGAHTLYRRREAAGL